MKKILALTLAILMISSLFVGVALAEESVKIGVSFSNLTNTVWAELCDEAVKYAKETYNADVTITSFDGDV